MNSIDLYRKPLTRPIIEIYSFWYSIRVILPGATGSLQDSIRILENTFSFWALSETVTTLVELPFLGRSMEAHRKTSTVFIFISTMAGLGAYSGGVGVSTEYFLPEKGVFRIVLS